jgi:hypothetical protein
MYLRQRNHTFGVKSNGLREYFEVLKHHAVFVASSES